MYFILCILFYVFLYVFIFYFMYYTGTWVISPVGDEAPVLHGPGREVRQGDHVLFGEGEGDVEILFEEPLHGGPDGLRVLGLANRLLASPNWAENKDMLT